MKLKEPLRHHAIIILFSFLVSAFIIGIAGALQTPTLSRFLTDEVHASPFWVGMFYSINAVAGLVASFIIAERSDTKGDRRNFIIFCSVMGIGNCLTFAFTRHYFALLTIGIFFSALASAAMPQVFALAREYAVKTGRNVVAFNSLLRAQWSLAWVIGPPLSFILAINYGFTFMYLCAAVMFVVAVVIVVGFFPSIPRGSLPVIATDMGSETILGNRSVIFLFIASVCMWTANMMYLIDMPLYIDQALHLEPALAGHLMGLAAGIEIPVMIIAGFLVPYIGKRNLFFFAVICGAIFYIGMVAFTDVWILFVLQIFNALFIGIVASIGIIYFQDLMPNRVGVASTLFNNSVIGSVILAGLIQGSVTATLGHHAIYWIALVMVLISLVLCTRVRAV